MKNIFFNLVILMVVIVAMSSCDQAFEPYDSKSSDAALATAADMKIATYGTYAGLVNEEYTRVQHFMLEYPGDNVSLSGTTSDALYNTYNYTHFPTMYVTEHFWRQAYKTIFSANQLITNIADGESAELDQLKGENLFVRALAHFDLVRLFGRPYSQANGNNPGVVIEDGTSEEEFPPRSTVAEVYNFIVADLQKAASLMTVNKPASFASKEAAYALLSRVYLYMEDNEKAVEYATMVIDSERYQLLPTSQYREYFTVAPGSNAETIFAFHHTLADNRDKGAIGSMYYNNPETGSSGWGEMFASMDYVKLLDQHPEDARHSFIELQMSDGDTLKRNGVPRVYVNKYNWQEGVVNLSSPVYLRLAEMYLNRAEANAKLGNYEEAIADVNIIRTRANLSGDALYTVNDLKGHESVFDVVLEERRLELAFEGHRPQDLFRNNRPLIRAYPGFHGEDLYHQVIPADHPRAIFYIPEREMIVNPNLKPQNP